MAAALEEEGAPEAVFDERFEYDAPRFYDFDEGSPAGAPADGWFDTEGPKGEAWAPGGPLARVGSPSSVEGANKCRWCAAQRVPRVPPPACRPGDAAAPRRRRGGARAGAPWWAAACASPELLLAVVCRLTQALAMPAQGPPLLPTAPQGGAAAAAAAAHGAQQQQQGEAGAKGSKGEQARPWVTAPMPQLQWAVRMPPPLGASPMPSLPPALPHRLQARAPSGAVR